MISIWWGKGKNQEQWLLQATAIIPGGPGGI